MKVLKNLIIFLVFFSFIFLLQAHPSYAWLNGWNKCRTFYVKEMSGYSENFKVVEYNFTGLTFQNATKEIRILNQSCSGSGGVEIPSSVISYGGSVDGNKWAVVAFTWNFSANVNYTFSIYYDNPSATEPNYVVDPYFTANNTEIKNAYFKIQTGEFTDWGYSNPSYHNRLYWNTNGNGSYADNDRKSLGTEGVSSPGTNTNQLLLLNTSLKKTIGITITDTGVTMNNNFTLYPNSNKFEFELKAISGTSTASSWWNSVFMTTYASAWTEWWDLRVNQSNMSVVTINASFISATAHPYWFYINQKYLSGNSNYLYILFVLRNTSDYTGNFGDRYLGDNNAHVMGTDSASITPTGAKKFRVIVRNSSWTDADANIEFAIYNNPPVFTIGAEEGGNQPPAITISFPANTTYFYSNNFQFIFKATDDSSTTFQLKAFLDGSLVYDSSSYQNNTQINLTQNLNLPKQYNFTVWANDTQGVTSSLTVIFTIKDFEIQQITYNSIVYETTTQSFTETIRVNFDLISNLTANLFWNSTDKGSCSQSVNSTHIILSQAIDIPLVQTNNTAISFFFRNYITYTNGSSSTTDSASNNQNILFAYQPTVSLSGVVTYNSTYYSNSTTFNFVLNNLTASRVNIRIYANSSLIKDDNNLNFTHTPLTDALYQYQYSISFGGSERYFGPATNIYYLYTLQMNHTLNITFGFWDTTPQQSFNFSVYSPYAPYVNCSLLNIYNYTYYRNNMSVWYTYTFPVSNSPITLNFICKDFFNTNSSTYEYPVYIIQIKPVDEEVGVFNTSLWLDPSTNKTAIVRFVAISPLFNQSILYERLNSTLWLIVPTNTWILTVQTLYSLQYFTQTYVLRDWVKYDMPICIPENKPQNLQTAYTTVPIDWSFIIRRGDTGCVKTIDKATNSLGNYFGFYFYTLPGIYTVSRLENGTEIFISALRGESENLVDLQKIIYQWQQTLRKIATIVRITTVNVLGGDNSTIVYVTTSMEDDYRLDIERDGTVIYSQTFPSSQNFTLNLLWRTVGINPDDKLTFKLYGSNGLIYQVVSTATGKIYKYSAMFTGIILTVLLVITFLKPINIEKIFILSLVTLFAAFYFIPQTEPNIYLNMLGFGVIILVVSSGVIAWKTIR